MCRDAALLEEPGRKVADLAGCEDALTLPTGHLADLSVFRSLLDPPSGCSPAAAER